jgi:hypothetical protein
MESKMKADLRTAAWVQAPRLCIGPSGMGSKFGNPARATALMWKQLLFLGQELCGAFTDIVFAIDISASSASNCTLADITAYKGVFHPNNVIPTKYRITRWEEQNCTQFV